MSSTTMAGAVRATGAHASPGSALDVTLTGVPSVMKVHAGFPSGPVDGYPPPTSYRVVPSAGGPVLVMSAGLWGDQPSAIFADVSRRGFDVSTSSGFRRVGDEQHIDLRPHGSAA